MSKAKASVAPDPKLNPAAQAKRKREALGEVTSLVTNNRAKNMATGAGQAAAKSLKGNIDSLKEKLSKGKAPTVVEPRQPLRTVAGPTTRKTTRPALIAQAIPVPALKSETQAKVKDAARVKVHEDSAMAIDPPVSAATRVSTRQAVVVLAKTQVTTEIKEEIKTEIARHSATFRRESRLLAQQRQHQEVLADDRICKKQRTSSVPPEDEAERKVEVQEVAGEVDPAVEAHAGEEEAEADPEGDEWVDLDAEDANDPLMVSEYILDIVNYMQELEVSPALLSGY